MEFIRLLFAPVFWVLRMIGHLLGISTAVVYRDLGRLEWSRPSWWMFNSGLAPKLGLKFWRRRSPTIDGCWLSGEGVLRKAEPGKHGIRRLILPHPAATALVDFEEATGQEYRYPATIASMSKRAMEVLDIEVAWYPDLVHVFFTLKSGWPPWVLIEPHPPSTGDSKAPVYRLGLINWHLRRFYRRAFGEMWQRCPKKEDGTPLIDERYFDADEAALLGLINEHREKHLALPLPESTRLLTADQPFTCKQLAEYAARIRETMVSPQDRDYSAPNRPRDTKAYKDIREIIRETDPDMCQKIEGDWKMPRLGGGHYPGRESEGLLLLEWIRKEQKRRGCQAVNSS